ESGSWAAALQEEFTLGRGLRCGVREPGSRFGFGLRGSRRRKAAAGLPHSKKSRAPVYMGLAGGRASGALKSGIVVKAGRQAGRQKSLGERIAPPRFFWRWSSTVRSLRRGTSGNASSPGELFGRNGELGAQKLLTNERQSGTWSGREPTQQGHIAVGRRGLPLQ